MNVKDSVSEHDKWLGEGKKRPRLHAQHLPLTTGKRSQLSSSLFLILTIHTVEPLMKDHPAFKTCFFSKTFPSYFHITAPLNKDKHFCLFFWRLLKEGSKLLSKIWYHVCIYTGNYCVPTVYYGCPQMSSTILKFQF